MNLRDFRKRLSTENLNIIGSGLRGTGSLTMIEMDVLNRSDHVFIDGYTSIFPEDFREDLERRISKPVIYLRREEVETFSFIRDSNGEISLIVSGDPMTSTTHFSIIGYCKLNNIKWRIFENASITGAVPGRTGLSSYRTGITVSLPEMYENFVPVSPLQKIVGNLRNMLHTILLIDLKNGRNLDIGRVHEIMEIMMDKLGFQDISGIPVLILQRVGWQDEHIFTSTLDKMGNLKVESPYCIVVPFRPDSNEIENMRSVGIAETSIFEKFNYEKALERLG